MPWSHSQKTLLTAWYGLSCRHSVAASTIPLEWTGLSQVARDTALILTFGPSPLFNFQWDNLPSQTIHNHTNHYGNHLSQPLPAI